MIELRKHDTLGHANHGWLNATHHFSFGNYHDRERMGWGNIRVWNDDIIGAQSGFPTHPHRDMEIITYVYEGAITHRDNLGNHGRTVAGDVQIMSAGTGVAHSEFNLESEATRLFQIWVLPDRAGHAPSWGTREFPRGDRDGGFAILASGHEGDGDALRINGDARVLGTTLTKGQSADYHAGADRVVYLVAARGKIEVNGVVADAHDGVAIKDEDTIRVTALENAEIVLVDGAP